MARRSISENDLSWLILQELRDAGFSRSITLAVVDDSNGWRCVIGRRSRTYITPQFMRLIAEVEDRLRKEYSLKQ
jgi:hypothetical protein